MRNWAAWAGALVFVAAAAAQARADTIALAFTGGTPGTASADNTLGWAFTLNTNVMVTQLGVWDEGDNGLAQSHDIGIFPGAGGAPLMTATASAGTGDPLTDGFRYVTLGSAVLLTPGDYLIGAFYLNGSGDRINGATATLTTASGIVYLGGRRGIGGALINPTIVVGTPNTHFGPNFQFVANPEPGTIALFALGGLGLAGVVVRRRRAAKRPA
jgi:hypothetical protein